MSNNKFPLHPLYINNASGKGCHPNAPNGGGGPGFFTQAGSLGDSLYGMYSGLPHPYSPAACYLLPQKIQTKAESKAFSITDIPAIMRSHGWHKGATLMDSWFARSAKIAPNYDTADTNTITMEWVLGYEKANKVYDKLVKERIWQNEAARKEIRKMLQNKGLLIPNSCFFNLFGNSFSYDDYINQRVVSGTELDDLGAALANFVFNVLVAGQVSSDGKTDGYKVEIMQVGVYIKDSYDFNGNQFLGYWDNNDNSVSMFNPLSGTSVSNNDFSDWRTKNKKGGDFRVFSDIKKIQITPPDTFYIK